MKRFRCTKCKQLKPENQFLGVWCTACRGKYQLPAAQRAAKQWRSKTPATEALRVRFTMRSANVKTGPIPVTVSSPSTCPKSCPWYGDGCYAEHSYMGHRWRQTADVGMTWEHFCLRIRNLPDGQLWRHNEAGDLPGYGEQVDIDAIKQLVAANMGRRGFTYTHKKSETAFTAVHYANAYGFTINISCDSLAEVDLLREQRPKMPLTVAIPMNDMRTTFLTPAGNRVTVCPAQTQDEMNCLKCQLCAVPTRRTVVAFRAHGAAAPTMSVRLVQLGLPL